MFDKTSMKGKEKRVVRVDDEAWSITHDEYRINPKISKTKEWIRASFLLGQILYQLLPENIPEPKELTFTVEDTKEGMKRNVLRRTEFVEDKEAPRRWDKDKEIEKLRKTLQGFGVTVIDPSDRNFNFDGRNLVYIDTFDPLRVGLKNDKMFYFHNVDTALLHSRIISSRLSAPQKELLSAKLGEYIQLTENLLKRFNSDRRRD